MLKKLSSLFLAAVLIASGAYLTKPFSAVSAAEITESASHSGSYSAYLEENSNLKYADKTIVIDAADNYTTNQQTSKQTIDGKEFVITANEGYIEWSFEVKETALYHIAVCWANVPGKSLDITRSVYIDGKVPFDGMNSVYFRRKWKNTGDIYYDGSNNEYSKMLEEEISVQTSDFYSLSEYYAGGYNIVLTEGSHTLRFESIQEPMAINSIIFSPVTETKSYVEVKAGYDTEKKVSSNTAPIIIQGESSEYTSKNTIRPIADRSSPAVSPYDTLIKKLNTIGGENWNEAAQWIEWSFKAETSGLYKIVFHAKQDYKSGFSSSRRLLIDGKSPFKEADNIEFVYGLNWQNVTLGGEEEPHLVYLEKGEHKIRLEVSVSDEMSEIISEALTLQDSLVSVYRRIIMITGTSPDSLRDYSLFSNITGLEETLREDLAILKNIVSKLESLGYSGSEISSMSRLIIQLEDFVADDENLPERLDSFNSNIMTFSSWITSVTQQPLLLDYIWIGSPNTELPEAESGFFKKFFDECYRLICSFANDYDVMKSKNNSKDSKNITLWLGQGIDQTIILKSMIDSDFTPRTDINVNIELVNMGVLLKAVAAGVGPDVAIFQGESMPVEYAMRDAVYDLTNFSDLNEVLKRFYPSAYESYKYEGGIYAIPETQTFSMMFYRSDIMKELNLDIPDTWNDLYSVLAKYQTNNLSISVPSPFSGGSGSAGLNSIFMMLLYQNGGTLYTENGKHCALNSENAVTAFSKWANLYTKYKIPQSTNSLTRFRMGESPIVIENFAFYNSLQISAPEIEGKWDIAPIPATQNSDGSLNRTQASSGTCALIFANAKDKKSSWEFIKWWTSEDAQTDYGIEIEALQGASARWSTANIAAFKNLPWSSKISKAIEEQRENVKGVPQVAGGYYTSRSIDNAIRSVVNQNENTRETILDYATEIDDEITVKRKEFKLEVD